MSDPKSTIYRACPHTKAKHAILKAYLERWLTILDRQATKLGLSSQRLLYVDGFAGAGEYEENVPGSPQIPIDVVANHASKFSCPIEVRLIEKRTDRASHLRSLIRDKKQKLVGANQLNIVDPVEGECEEQIRLLIQECQTRGRQVGPAFFFLDQFGYSSFSMDLIQLILTNDVCETFSYLNWNLLHPFMSDQSKHAGITKAFGGEEWKDVLSLSGHEKENRFRAIYLDALRSRGGAKYAYPFAMRGPDHRVIYWLFFCTNNIRGLEEMKKAMWSVDRSGGFEFSDKIASERSSLFEYNDDALANDLMTELNGNVMSVQQLQEYVLVNTPACKYFQAFGKMERAKQLCVLDSPAGRRSGSFKDYPSTMVKIAAPLTTTQGALFTG